MKIKSHQVMGGLMIGSVAVWILSLVLFMVSEGVFGDDDERKPCCADGWCQCELGRDECRPHCPCDGKCDCPKCNCKRHPRPKKTRGGP